MSLFTSLTFFVLCFIGLLDLSAGQRYYNTAAVSTDASRCSNIGADILKANGSAVDSIIAAAICMTVYKASSMGIGGGHSMTVYIRSTRRAYHFDARETAASIYSTETMAHGDAYRGGKAIALPGEVSGFGEAHRMFGRLPWASLFQPTIRQVMRFGINVTKDMAESLKVADETMPEDKVSKAFPNTADLRKVYTNPQTGKLYQEGELMQNRALLTTLRTIAEKGARDFYQGGLAKDIVSELQEAGSKLTAADFRNYKTNVYPALAVRLRTPNFGNVTMYTAHSPSSGGLLVYFMNIVDQLRISPSMERRDRAYVYHRLAEAMKFAFGQRTRYGDPAHWPKMAEVMRELTNRTFARRAVNKINSRNRTDNTMEYYGADLSTTYDHGTAHLAVMAPNGDCASMTSTVNYGYGSGVVGSKTGIVYNNQMYDFGYPGHTTWGGIPATPANYVRGNARPISSAVPAVIVDPQGNPLLVVGAAGGSLIFSEAAMYIVNLFYLDQPVDGSMSNGLRLHHQLRPNTLQIGRRGLDMEPVRTELRQKYGHRVDTDPGGWLNAVGKMNNRVFASSRYGQPAGI